VRPTSPPAATRAERALATRRRMVRAATEIFSAEGYTGTTIAAVADRAGVAVPTLYYTFGTKTGLLGEVLGAAIIGIDRWREPPPEPFELVELMPVHRWWADFLSAPTASEALGVFVADGTDVLRRVGPLMPALHGATGDAEGQRLVSVSEERRVETYREVVRRLAEKPAGLRDGVDLGTATDIMVALFSPETYQALVGRGWPHERCAAFFEDAIGSQVLRPGP
jgi:AcrR family transcriptional regulator